MAKRTRAERVLCKLLAFAAVLSALAPAGVRAGAQTALSQDDFDALVSQYTISKDTRNTFHPTGSAVPRRS